MGSEPEYRAYVEGNAAPPRMRHSSSEVEGETDKGRRAQETGVKGLGRALT